MAKSLRVSPSVSAFTPLTPSKCESLALPVYSFMPTPIRLVSQSSGTRKRSHPLLSCQAVSTDSSSQQSVDELPENLQRIVKGFQAVPDPRARYQQLLYFASRLKPLAKEFQTKENKVEGCVSQVWVLPTLREDGCIYFEAESDSALTKGLAALLVEGLSGSTPAQILKVSPDFILQLGLKQSLTPSRNNGFLNMLKLMQKKTLELQLKKEAENAGKEKIEVEGNSTSSSGRPIYDAIHSKLSAALSPIELVVEDVSHEHKGHRGVGKDASETHFVVRVVSEAFEGLSSMKRHRLIYSQLNEEFKKGLHALSIVAKTPVEVQK